MDATIRGFGVGGYRSFGELQYVGPFGKINLVAGKNNVGKSNVIRFLHEHLPSYRLWVPSGLDVTRVQGGWPYRVAICLPTTDDLIGAVSASSSIGVDELRGLLDCRAFRVDPSSDARWIRFVPNSNGSGSTVLDLGQADDVIDQLGRSRITSLASRISTMEEGEKYDDYIRLMEYICGRILPPSTTLVDAFRQVRAAVSGESDYAGAGLIERISALQNPEALVQPEAEAKYRAINAFISSVVGEEVRLEVPHTKQTVNLRAGSGLVLPLEHYGTGIHQLVIIAAAATVLEGRMICIEEPEMNLHPTLQRALLKYLHGTPNTYVISTHSAQMLDYERSSVFHIDQSDAGTRLSVATQPFEIARVCFDLGYRPSDLIQANAVIWVEGPSDRTYLNHWISAGAPDLVEGAHYSVMFYGGALLSQLSATDPAVTEFIRLRRLNRHLGILMDRDRASKNAPLNATKERVRGEFAASPENGFAWVVNGYTIENYVPVAILRQAVKDVHAGRDVSWNGSRWANPLRGFSNATSSTRPNKVAIAKKVVELWDDPLSDPDLRREVEVVVNFVRRANSA